MIASSHREDNNTLRVILGKPPRMQRNAERQPCRPGPLPAWELDAAEALAEVLRHPAVASKSFLVTIGDPQ